MPDEKIISIARGRTKQRPWIWARAQHVGNDRTKHVLVALAAYASDEDGTAFPSVKTIARECELSPSTIKRHIGKLVAAGLIDRRSRMIRGVHSSNLYVLAPWIESVQPCTEGSVQPCTEGSVQPCTEGSVQPCTEVGSAMHRPSVQSRTDKKNEIQRPFKNDADVLAHVRRRIGWKAYERVFDGCSAHIGPPVEIVFKHQFRASQALSEFGERLSELLGTDWKSRSINKGATDA
jgi:hypothetical protein